VLPVAKCRDLSLGVATADDDTDRGPFGSKQAATTDDKPRQAATASGTDARYVARLEDDVVFLRGQLEVKDKTIGALLERDRESNILVGQLQQLLAPLLKAPERGVSGTFDDHEPPMQNP
jgi:hypothetical protein